MNKSLPYLFNLKNFYSSNNYFKKINYQNKNAFTLIELLIVIVILTVLVGVMVTIIDPLGQQNKAEDAVLLSSINKIILSINSHTSAYGYAPTGLQLESALSNAKIKNGSCDDNYCLFIIESIALPKTCDSTNYIGSNSQDCYIRYEKVIPENSGDVEQRRSKEYKIYAKNFGTQEIIFYDSVKQKIQLCSNDTNLSSCYDL